MEYYIKVLKNYANFTGRARRKEFWIFVLINSIVNYGLIAIPLLDSMLAIIYFLALLVPTLAVICRRMHDVNKSGWFMFIPIYNFILAVTNGDVGENEYGQDPKEAIQDSDDLLDSNI